VTTERDRQIVTVAKIPTDGIVSTIVTSSLDLGVVELLLELLGLGDLAYSIHKVFLSHDLLQVSNGKHAGFGAYVAQICAVEAVC